MYDNVKIISDSSKIAVEKEYKEFKAKHPGCQTESFVSIAPNGSGSDTIFTLIIYY